MAADSGATTALPDDVKKNLKSIVLELRHLFEADLGLGLRRLGIDAETGKVTPADDPALSYLTAEEREARSSLDAVLAKEAAMTKDVPEAVRALLREAAYTHLNRLIGLKCLELRGHLTIDGERTEVVTQRKDYGDLSKYLWTLRSRDARLLGDPELLWREGLVRACEVASAELGVLFDPDDPYARVWPSHKALVQAVRSLNELPESVFRTDELLGWVYQYFQSEEKDRIFAEVKTRKKKIAWSDIVPVTQLYTERYMVEFLLQNSIGARWMEMYPESRLKEAWPYYVEPATPHKRDPQPVKEWTILDLCCGSGHFLVVAFDLLVQLYAEERALANQGLVQADWCVPEDEVGRSILGRNLYGVDIDPRAVQLTALALHLKAKESGLDVAPQMHLVIADCVLQRGEHFQAVLDAYEDDPAASEAIEAIWSALEHVRDLGSLVRIEEEVEAAVVKSRRRSAGTFEELSVDWDLYKAQLVARLRKAFADEATSRDERLRVFGAEAEKGLDLFGLLSARYDVVCTNPPYMGSKNMGKVLKEYITRQYPSGKRDLFAAFILRAVALSARGGHVAMVTQQAWLFLRSYAALRSGASGSKAKPKSWPGVIVGTSVCTLAHLGEKAFSDSAAAGAFVVLFTLRNERPVHGHHIAALRLIGSKSPHEKRTLLQTRPSSISSNASQEKLLLLPECPIVYWLSDSILDKFSSRRTLESAVFISKGVRTGDDPRWVRLSWETADAQRWVDYSKGGRYVRWCGDDLWVLDWEDGGRPFKDYVRAKYPLDKFTLLIRHDRFFGSPGWAYSAVGRGSVGVRHHAAFIATDTAPTVRPLASESGPIDAEILLLNSRAASFFARTLNPASISMDVNYVQRIPLPDQVGELPGGVGPSWYLSLKTWIVRRRPVERAFRQVDWRASEEDCVAAVLLAQEGLLDRLVCDGYRFTSADCLEMVAETGTSAGWHRLLSGYDRLPELPSGLPEPSADLRRHLADGPRVEPSARELAGMKRNLRDAYVAGAGVAAEGSVDFWDGETDEVDTPAARIPVPSETFLEELSQKLEVHPISVYWLLKELRSKEGVVCPSEAKRRAEDWLSVTLLRMLGHRWPLQDQYEEEEGKPFLDPAWVDADALIALTSDMGEDTLSERFRGFLDAEFDPDHGHEVEVELAHTLGWKPGTEWGKQKPMSLEDWFKRDFFRRHVSQFKRRPIAWHLKSAKGTVQVIVYYHGFNRDRLALLRAGYLGNLRQELSGKLAAAAAKGYEDRANVARIDEFEKQLADLKAFDAKLAQLQEGRKREARIWCPWKTPEEQPHGWDPDINDGVRVNIAPLQRLGLLAADVLNKKDLNSLLPPEGRG